jgi:hypothetical protein
MSFENIPTSGGTARRIATVATVGSLPTGVPEGSIRYVEADDTLYTYDGTTWTAVGAGTGDVVGPASSTDNALARYDGATGKLLQDTSTFTIDDKGKMNVTALLNEASGAEVGLTYTYTTNKAAGSDTGMVLNFIDTASPGTSNLVDFQKDGVSFLQVTSGTLNFPTNSNITNVGQITLSTFRNHVLNTTLLFQGRISTGTGGTVFCIRFDNQGFGNMTPTAGTVGYVQIGPPFGTAISQFAPTSGNANYIVYDTCGVVNTTGTYSGGTTIGSRLSMRYTSSAGTTSNRLVDYGTNNGTVHTSRFIVDSVGKVGIGVTTLAAMLEIQAASSTTVGQVVRAAASVSVNIEEWQSSASAVLASITSGGTFNSAGFTASRAVVSDASKNLVTIATTDTELGYVNGVTSAIQTQIDARLCTTTIVNVSSDVTLTNKALHFVDTSAGRTLTLPAPSTNLFIIVKDSTGGALANNITINPASGTIDGAGSYAIALNYGSVTIASNGTNYFTIGRVI